MDPVQQVIDAASKYGLTLNRNQVADALRIMSPQAALEQALRSSGKISSGSAPSLSGQEPQYNAPSTGYRSPDYELTPSRLSTVSPGQTATGDADRGLGLGGAATPTDYTAKLAAAGWVQLPSGKWLNPFNGDTVDPNTLGNSAPGTSAGEWARLAVEQERLGFDREKYAQDFTEGQRQFDATQGIALRRLGIDEADLKDKREQFATNFAENQRQFNTTEGRLSSQFSDTQALERSRLDQEGAYQQGQLGIDRSRLEQEGAYQQGQLRLGQDKLGLDRQIQEQENAIKRQQNALAKQQYIGKVLSSPSDFIARAFMQRGVGSPTTPITQADLINQINTEYNANPITFQAPQTTPGAPQPQQYAMGTPDSGGPGSSNVDPEIDPRIKKEQGRLESLSKLLQHVMDPDTQHRLVDELAQGRSRLSPPAMASGSYGTVNDKQAIVGDPQTPGVPNPEMVINPTGAPIAVVPMNRLGGAKAYATGTPGNMNTQYSNGWNNNFGNYDSLSSKPLAGKTTLGSWYDSPYLSRNVGVGTRQSISGNGILSDYVNPTEGQRSLFDSWNSGQLNDVSGGRNFSQWVQAGQPMTRLGGGAQAPASTVMPTTTPTTTPVDAKLKQEQLILDAENTLPPALRQLFGEGDAYKAKPRLTTGGTNNPLNPTGIDPLKFGFNLFSPQAISQLTSAEQEALNSYLGVKYNTTLEDVGTAIQQTFGGQTGRRGRLVSG